MEDTDIVLLFEVTLCFHPTEYDKVGKDGVYVKQVRRIDSGKDSETINNRKQYFLKYLTERSKN